MDIIKEMLTGQMDMQEFSILLKTSETLRNDLRSLIPKEIIEDRENKLWQKTSYEMLKKYDFDLVLLLESMFRFDGSISDNLNIFGTISTIFCYLYPTTICTKKYRDRFSLYLDSIRDCFDGPEVTELVQRIIQDALLENTRKKQQHYAKSRIKTYFHVESKTPRWIQGPEWPMGASSPMRFISQERINESVHYHFEDIDSGERRIVKQYY